VLLEHVGRRDVDRHPQDLLGLPPKGGKIQERAAKGSLPSVTCPAVSKRKTRERQLAKLAARRAAERRRRRRQRILAGAVAGVVFIAGGVVAVLAFTGGGKEHKKPRAHKSPTPTASQTTPSGPVPACAKPLPSGSPSPSATFAAEPKLALEDKPYFATFKTSCGDFVVRLLADRAPHTVNSFVFLADKGFYDHTYFHRIANELDVIQGGDPTESGGGGPGYTIPDELGGDETYPPGTLAMANTGAPNSGGSQFFVITGPNGHGLDQNNTYTVFGKIVEGLDVAQLIQTDPVQGSAPGDPSSDGKPTFAIYINKVVISNTGPAAPSPTPTAGTPSAVPSETPPSPSASA